MAVITDFTEIFMAKDQEKSITAIARATAHRIWAKLHGDQTTATPDLLDKDRDAKMQIIQKEIEEGLKADRLRQEGERHLRSIRPQHQNPAMLNPGNSQSAVQQQQQQTHAQRVGTADERRSAQSQQQQQQ